MRTRFNAMGVNLFVRWVCLVTAVPFIWLAINSFKTKGELFPVPFYFLPKEPTLLNFETIFFSIPFPRYFYNSVFIAIVYTALSVFLGALAGFAFAKYDFRLRNGLFLVAVGSMMIPFYVLIIPLYLLLNVMGWADTYQGVIIPWVASGFAVFMMRQYMMTIPSELLDAARIDGASEFRLFWQIALPLSKPALVTLAVVHFMWSWNDLVWPLIVLKSQNMFTLPIAIASFLSIYNPDWGAVMAGSFFATLPVLILFAFTQKYYIEGLTAGAIK